MNSILYIDELLIKDGAQKDDFGRSSGTSRIVRGYLETITKIVSDNNTVKAVSMNLFSTDELLHKSDIIIMDDKNYDIKSLSVIKNHFTGNFDHTEVLF
jgi:hypothetical protein